MTITRFSPIKKEIKEMTIMNIIFTGIFICLYSFVLRTKKIKAKDIITSFANTAFSAIKLCFNITASPWSFRASCSHLFSTKFIFIYTYKSHKKDIYAQKYMIYMYLHTLYTSIFALHHHDGHVQTRENHEAWLNIGQ